MAITKPPVLPAWAESGDRVTPSNAEIQVGWPLSSIPPSRQRFNWLLNYLANAVRYFSRRGIPDYDAAETYMIGDRIIGDDGKTYRSLIDTNLAQTPSTSPTKWEEWAPTLARFAALIQGQTYTAFTTAGAAPNFTLTPSPAITAYTAGQRFRVKFHAVGAGADQLNVSALGNKALKQYDSTGAKVAAIVAANQLVDVEYDGVDMVMLDPLPPAIQTSAAIQGTFKNLKASATGLSANISVSADEIAVENGSNAYQTLRAIALTISGAASGVANGLDTGALAINTWYSVWVIWNGATAAGLLSLSPTAPTMPGGYTHKARVGWIRTDASGSKFPLGFVQYGRSTQYVVAAGSNVTALPIIASGIQGAVSTTLVAASVSSFVPTTASRILGTLFNGGGGNSSQISPSITAATPGGAGIDTSGAGGSTQIVKFDFLLESTNLYYSGNGASSDARCNGWEDNL
jgi:hypothetical protein